MCEIKDGGIVIVKVKEDLTGLVFGRLTVAGRADDYVYPNGKRRSQWACRCECGNIVSVETSNLKRGNSKSCGCLNDELSTERFTTHGGRHERLYSIWTNMKNRCLNERSPSYLDYGGRGITICDEWVDSYENFRAWAYESGYDESKPISDCTIDRIDTDAGYSPGNCRWTDAKMQANNRRNTMFVTAFGSTHSLSEWAEITGIKYHTLFARITKLGWTAGKALSTR